MTQPLYIDALYLGDTSLSSAAAYLAGLMSHWGWRFDYVPSDQPLANEMVQAPRPLYIVSDYPARLAKRELQEQVVSQVADGAGLLMIGGWESFVGSGGNWQQSPLAEILPVEMGEADDRLNGDHLLLVRQTASHPAVDGLPWNDRPPLVGGLNRVKPKAGSRVLLEVRRFALNWKGDDFEQRFLGAEPLLVIGQHGQGRVAALMTDVAPHWVGPLIDWGDERVNAQAHGAEAIEVGSLYAQWLRQLLHWVKAAST